MDGGKVYLVGAGPGDPGLITQKGLECISRSDVIIYDFLASPVLLRYASSHAEIIYVGKRGGDHTLAQDQINHLIIEKAGRGLTVTRLKGGDPFIFGRGGEEAEELAAAGIPFEVVPGVTSAIAAPAYAGIPLTHRNFTSTLAFITGHEDPAKGESGIDWHTLATGIGTLVFLMGVKNLPRIIGRLKENGMDPNTSVALIQWGTTPQQRTVSGTLKTIVGDVEKAGLKAPAIIVVGRVVTLRDRLKWVEKKPLLGKRIIVTRAREQASRLVQNLSDLGARCIEFPTIRIMPPQSWDPLDNAIDGLNEYHWIIFTSVNGVRFFFERLFMNNRDVRSLGHVKTACIGPATAAELFTFGIRTDVLPDSYRAESVVDAFRDIDIRNRKILLPRAENARPVLPKELRKMGAAVDEITAYTTQTVAEESGFDQDASLLETLAEKGADVITFTSSSTVTNFKAMLPEKDFAALMQGLTVACIGPITAETAEKLGFHVNIIADRYTIDGLCDAIIAYFRHT
ncbi:MAG: uroporphyrinogen-III C-methyltransferase [Desulfobacterales bacterium]